MVSSINPANPVAGTPTTQSVRDNFQIAHDEISALQAAGPYAPIASPALTGTPTAPTPAPGDSDLLIATTAFVAAAVASALHNVGRNLIHNSLFNIAQRGVGPWSTSGSYTVDRWVMFVSGGDALSVGFYAAEVAGLSGDESIQHFIGCNVTGSATAGSYSQFCHRIENLARLSGKTVTVSFGANCGSGSPLLGIALSQLFGSGGLPSPSVDTPTQTVTLSPTAARYSLTFNIPSIAGKTLGTNGDHCTQLSFILSSPTAPTVAQTANINIWGVQLEIGSTATPLEKPDPQHDLAKCQRFYQIVNFLAQNGNASGSIGCSATLPVAMRTTPTVVLLTTSGSVNIASPAAGALSNFSVNATAGVSAAGLAVLVGAVTASADL